MNQRTIQWVVIVALVTFGVEVVTATDTPKPPSTKRPNITLDELEGQSVDIAPWAYAWRADRAIQEKPEAYFIPRRLDRIDKVYRTAFAALPEPELKSIHYDMPDLLKHLPLPPQGRLQAGLLWTGRLDDYQVELHWPETFGRFRR